MPNILIVEDDYFIREVYELLLIDEGDKIRSVRSVPDALDTLAEWHPDLILLDWALSRSRGDQLLEVLHEQEQLQDIPVFVVSATDYHEEALALGVATFMMKPFEVDELLREIRRLLTRGKAT